MEHIDKNELYRLWKYHTAEAIVNMVLFMQRPNRDEYRQGAEYNGEIADNLWEQMQNG